MTVKEAIEEVQVKLGSGALKVSVELEDFSVNAYWLDKGREFRIDVRLKLIKKE